MTTPQQMLSLACGHERLAVCGRQGLLLLGICLGAPQGYAKTDATAAVAPWPEQVNAERARSQWSVLPGAVPTAPVRLRVWGFEVYDARLWTPLGFHYTQHAQYPFALELQYLRRLEGAAIASRSIDEMRRVADFSEAQAQSWRLLLHRLFPDVQPGDRLTGVNLPGEGAEFWFNGQRLGGVKDPVFARLFFGIWLHERTSQPDLRAQLLQGLSP